jgi:antitoxin component YwqK of YwqJK toxin-antitoxin module
MKLTDLCLITIIRNDALDKLADMAGIESVRDRLQCLLVEKTQIKLFGKYRKWHDNSYKQLAFECTYRDGLEIEEAWDKEGWPLYTRGYWNGKKHGVWREYKKGTNLPLKEDSYDQGIQHGVWRRWHLSTNRLSDEYMYCHNKLENVYAEYYENGKLKDLWYFKNGHSDGRCTTWFENGEPYKEREYTMGMLDGLLREWYDNGNLCREQYYRADLKHGPYTLWDYDGRIIESGMYHRDELVYKN